MFSFQPLEKSWPSLRGGASLNRLLEGPQLDRINQVFVSPGHIAVLLRPQSSISTKSTASNSADTTAATSSSSSRPSTSPSSTSASTSTSSTSSQPSTSITATQTCLCVFDSVPSEKQLTEAEERALTNLLLKSDKDVIKLQQVLLISWHNSPVVRVWFDYVDPQNERISTAPLSSSSSATSGSFRGSASSSTSSTTWNQPKNIRLFVVQEDGYLFSWFWMPRECRWEAIEQVLLPPTRDVTLNSTIRKNEIITRSVLAVAAATPANFSSASSASSSSNPASSSSSGNSFFSFFSNSSGSSSSATGGGGGGFSLSPFAYSTGGLGIKSRGGNQLLVWAEAYKQVILPYMPTDDSANTGTSITPNPSLIGSGDKNPLVTAPSSATSTTSSGEKTPIAEFKEIRLCWCELTFEEEVVPEPELPAAPADLPVLGRLKPEPKRGPSIVMKLNKATFADTMDEEAEKLFATKDGVWLFTANYIYFWSFRARRLLSRRVRFVTNLGNNPQPQDTDVVQLSDDQEEDNEPLVEIVASTVHSITKEPVVLAPDGQLYLLSAEESNNLIGGRNGQSSPRSALPDGWRNQSSKRGDEISPTETSAQPPISQGFDFLLRRKLRIQFLPIAKCQGLVKDPSSSSADRQVGPSTHAFRLASTRSAPVQIADFFLHQLVVGILTPVSCLFFDLRRGSLLEEVSLPKSLISEGGLRISNFLSTRRPQTVEEIAVAANRTALTASKRTSKYSTVKTEGKGGLWTLGAAGVEGVNIGLWGMGGMWLLQNPKVIRQAELSARSSPTSSDINEKGSGIRDAATMCKAWGQDRWHAKYLFDQAVTSHDLLKGRRKDKQEKERARVARENALRRGLQGNGSRRGRATTGSSDKDKEVNGKESDLSSSDVENNSGVSDVDGAGRSPVGSESDAIRSSSDQLEDKQEEKEADLLRRSCEELVPALENPALCVALLASSSMYRGMATNMLAGYLAKTSTAPLLANNDNSFVVNEAKRLVKRSIFHHTTPLNRRLAPLLTQYMELSQQLDVGESAAQANSNSSSNTGNTKISKSRLHSPISMRQQRAEVLQAVQSVAQLNEISRSELELLEMELPAALLTKLQQLLLPNLEAEFEKRVKDKQKQKEKTNMMERKRKGSRLKHRKSFQLNFTPPHQLVFHDEETFKTVFLPTASGQKGFNRGAIGGDSISNTKPPNDESEEDDDAQGTSKRKARLQRRKEHPYYEMLCRLLYREKPRLLLPFIKLVYIHSGKGQSVFERALNALPPFDIGSPDTPPLTAALPSPSNDSSSSSSSSSASTHYESRLEVRVFLLCKAHRLASAVRTLLSLGRWERAFRLVEKRLVNASNSPEAAQSSPSLTTVTDNWGEQMIADGSVGQAELFHILLTACLEHRRKDWLANCWPLMPSTYRVFDLIRVVRACLPDTSLEEQVKQETRRNEEAEEEGDKKGATDKGKDVSDLVVGDHVAGAGLTLEDFKDQMLRMFSAVRAQQVQEREAQEERNGHVEQQLAEADAERSEAQRERDAQQDEATRRARDQALKKSAARAAALDDIIDDFEVVKD